MSDYNLIQHSIFTMRWLPLSYLSKHAFFLFFFFLKHVPAQDEKEKHQGLATKEKPKKDKIIPAAVLRNCSL